MPNNVNLGTARAIQAALMHTKNNGLKMGRFGALQAMLSPAVEQVRNEISPYGPQAQEYGLQWDTPVGREIQVPQVTVKTYPARVVTGFDERTRDLVGENLSTPVSTTVVYDFYKEIKINRQPARELYEPAALDYMQQFVSGQIEEIGDPRYAAILDRLGLQIIQDFNDGVALPTNDWVLTSLIARIGKNAADVTAVTPTAAAPVITVPTFNTDRSLKADFWDFINETKIANKIQGNLMLIGGQLAQRAMRREGILSVNDAGYDWAAMFGRTPVDFYYDERIDSVFGAGKILLVDSGAAAAETFCYADFDRFVDPTNSDDTVDEKARIMFMDLPEEEAVLMNLASSFIREVDVRVTRKRDDNDFAKTTATVALAAGMWIRPNGWFTADTSNVLNGVSGIFAATLS